MADKEATVYIIDVGRSMGKKNNGREQTDLDWSMDYVWDKIATTILTERKTLQIGIVGLRTDDTNHSLEGEEYDHISILSPIKQFLMPDVRQLRDLVRPSNTNEGDAISSLVVAVQLIAAHCKHLKFKKNIFLVTDGRGSIDADDTDGIVNKIKKDNINLTILGVDFDDAEFGFKEEEKDTQKTENEAVLEKLGEDCGGTYGTMAEAVAALGIPRVKPVRPIPSFKGTLTLGDPSQYDTAMTIRVHRYPRVKVAKPPSASSFVVRQDMGQEAESSAAAMDKNGDVEMTDRDGLVSVKTTRMYQVEDEDAPGGKRDVEFDDLAKGYEYGRTAVAISQSDLNVTELEVVEGMEIVGFVPRDKVIFNSLDDGSPDIEQFSRYLQMSETYVIIADPIDGIAKMALSSMIHALWELDSYAIVRFVRNLKSQPTLLLLAPSIEPGFECLIDVELPFAEDIRQYKFPPLDRVVTVAGKSLYKHRNIPEPDLQQAMDEYVDNMDLSTFSHDDDGKPAEYAPVDETYSPVLHHINQAIRHHAVHPSDPIPAPYEVLMKYSSPPEDLTKQAKPYLDAVMRTGNVKKVPAKPKFRSRGAARREAEKPLSGLDVDALLAPAGGAAKRLVAVSAQNAIPEFKQVLQTTEDEADIFEAVRLMQGHVEGYISQSFGDSGYGRALEALGVVRQEMVELEYPDVYNKMLKEIKGKILGDELGSERREMWGQIKKSKLGLIDKNLSEHSNVTEEEAQAFWAPGQK